MHIGTKAYEGRILYIDGRETVLTLRKYLLKRVVVSVFVLWLIATFNFLVFPSPVANIHLEPPGGYYSGYEPDPETKEALLRYFGWDDPVFIRYLKYLYSLFTFGAVPPYLGWSTLHNEFVAEGLSWRLPITLFLLGMALLGVMMLGVPMGVFAGSKRGSKRDVAFVGSGILTWGVPSFYLQWLAIFFVGGLLRDRLGIRLFATTWGTIYVPRSEVPLQWWGTCLSQLALPILTLVAIGFGAWVVRTRFMIVDALTKDFILTARAKGLSENRILFKHAFRSILPQISTMITLSIPAIVTGSFITEYIFGIQGIGRYLIYAIEMGEVEIFILDSAVMQAVFFIWATLVVLLNLMADVLYGILDPRIRVGTQK